MDLNASKNKIRKKLTTSFWLFSSFLNEKHFVYKQNLLKNLLNKNNNSILHNLSSFIFKINLNYYDPRLKYFNAKLLLTNVGDLLENVAHK